MGNLTPSLMYEGAKGETMILSMLMAVALPYAGMPATNVMVRVGTNELTKGAIDARVPAEGPEPGTSYTRSRFVKGFIEWCALRGAGGYSNVCAGIKVEVPESEVDLCISNAVAYNARARVARRERFALATNVWEKAVKGASMDTLARKHSEDDFAQETSVWGSFSETDLKEFKVDDAILGKEEGTVLPPMEKDNCLVVMRLSAIEEEDGEKKYEIQRVAIRLPMMVEPQTRAEIRKDLEDAERDEKFKARLAELVKAQEVEWPHGLEFLSPPAEDGAQKPGKRTKRRK